MPNGSSGESSRKKHKDQEVCDRGSLRFKFRTKLQVELSFSSPLSYLILMDSMILWNAPHDVETLLRG